MPGIINIMKKKKWNRVAENSKGFFLSTRKGLLRWHNESARTQRAIETYLMWWGMEQVFQEEVKKKKKVGGTNVSRLASEEAIVHRMHYETGGVMRTDLSQNDTA